MSKLFKYAFSDLYDISSGISSTKDQAGHGTPFASFRTVFNNIFLPDKLPDLMEVSEKEQKIYSIKKGDILITRTSETVDELAMSCVALKDYPQATYSGFVKRLRPKTEGIVYDRFMAFFLRSKYFRKVIECNTIMTLRASFNEDIFSFLDLYLPDYETQKRIGDLLYHMERKRENNAQINDNLQQQLKLMYDYWFNQFDFPNEDGKPYRASGGAMEWSPDLQREIPAGWSCVPLEDILQRNSEAFDFSSIEPTVDLSIMPSGSIALDQVNRSDKFSTNLFRMNEGDILFGSIRPYLKKAGIAPCNGVVAGTIHSFRVKRKSDYNFALFTLCGKAFFDYAVRVSTGTKMPIVSLDSIMSYKVPYSESIVRRFNHIDVRHIICSNVQETQKLASFRDWLLPMLMNGQATISD